MKSFRKLFGRQIGALAMLAVIYYITCIIIYSQTLMSVILPLGEGSEGLRNAMNPNQPIHWRLSKTSPQDFSACLLVMDDNHYLIEWLSYHYHTLNLRNLIIVSDENSMTSPYLVLERWKTRMNIQLWRDEHYFSSREFEEAQQQVIGSFGSDIPSSLVKHRARQRLFYYRCMNEFKKQGKTWVLLTDTDEFVRLNYETVKSANLTAPPITRSGSVSQFLQQYTPSSTDSSTVSVQENMPLYIMQSSPCLQVPRLRFAGGEELSSTIDGFNTSQFLTQRWSTHAGETNYKKNKISKAIVDVSRIPAKEILPVDSIHLPVRSVCQQRRLHLRASQSLLLIHHYLGDAQQYLYRENDARKIRTINQYTNSQNIGTSHVSKEIQPWLHGFVQNIDQVEFSFLHENKAKPTSKDLLKDVGVLQPKSWQSYDGPPKQDRCALCFFGLPRAYKTMVLPSIIRNILIPNARHNCDIYTHYYQKFSEEAGRRNRGGLINPNDVLLLEKEALKVAEIHAPKVGRNAHRVPLVAFTYDTDEQFLERRKSVLNKYRNTVGTDGKRVYFPWASKTYTNSSLDNIVRQWHSIESAFKTMDFYGKRAGINYTRVGMFRNDAMYLSPIDISVLDKGDVDTKNEYVVTAPFARYPINDRMIYGPYQAVKIWSTRRFELIEKRVQLSKDPGFEMHSERFLNTTIFPAIEDLGFEFTMNRDICFVRTRADEAALANDCTVGGQTRGFGRVNKKALVEDIVGRNCTFYKMGFKWLGVGCGKRIKYFDGIQ
jgi:hypothetical protein